MSFFGFDVTDILDKAFQWFLALYFKGVSEIFTYISTIGVETLELPWVQALVTFCGYIGWGLFTAGLIVAVFDLAVEYQNGRGSIKDTAINALKAFFAVSLFTVLPIELYKFSVSLQKLFSKDVITGLGIPHESTEVMLQNALKTSFGFGTSGLTQIVFSISLIYCVIKIFLANLKRGGILLIQISVGTLHMFSLPRGYFTSFVSWCKQIIALCLTTFMQNLLMMIGLIVIIDNFILGLGVLLAASEVPRIADQFGLDTSVHGNVMSVVHATTSVVNLVRTFARK